MRAFERKEKLAKGHADKVKPNKDEVSTAKADIQNPSAVVELYVKKFEAAYKNEKKWVHDGFIGFFRFDWFDGPCWFVVFGFGFYIVMVLAMYFRRYILSWV